MDTLTSRFGKHVRKTRSLCNISQEKLAHMANIDRSHMGHIERGTKSPTLAKVEQIAKALNVQPASMMTEPLIVKNVCKH